MAMTKLKVAASVVLAAGIGTTVVVEHQALGRLREQNQALKLRVEQMSRQTEERQSRVTPMVEASAPAAQPEARPQDLDRLRNEVGALRGQTTQFARLRSENHALREATGEPETPAEAEFQQETVHRLDELKQWGVMFITYASGHAAKDRYPETWEEAAGQAPRDKRDALLDFANNNFEIVYHGPTGFHDQNSIRKPGQTLLFREKQARRSPKGDWVKTYGFADGHVESHTEPDNNFDGWEKQYQVESK